MRPIPVAFLAEHLGFNIAFYTFAAIVAVAAVIFIVFCRRRGQHQPPVPRGTPATATA